MVEYKEDETLLRTIFLQKILLITLAFGMLVSTFFAVTLNNEYNKLYTEATTRVEQYDIKIKELTIENRDLQEEYEQLLKDNEENVRQIEWLNDQMVKLRGG